MPTRADQPLPSRPNRALPRQTGQGLFQPRRHGLAGRTTL